MTKVKEGQVWKQGQGTPREGEDALWVVKGFPVVNTRYANMECLGVDETKQITTKTIENNYSLVDEDTVTNKRSEVCESLSSIIIDDSEVMDGTFLSTDTDMNPEDRWKIDDEKIEHLNTANRCGQNMLHWYIGIQANRARNNYYPEWAPQTQKEVAEHRGLRQSTVSKARKLVEFFDFQDYKDFSILPRRVLYRSTRIDDYDEAVQVLRKWARLYKDKEIKQDDMMDEIDEILGVKNTCVKDPNEVVQEDNIYSSNMVDIEGYELPRSNIYPKLFTGEYIVNPNYLIVYGDKCYGFDEWEPDIVIDGLAGRVRGDVSKGNWFEDHLGDTIEVFNVDKKEMIASYPVIACFPAMSPPTVNEAMEMARNHKRVIDKVGDEGTIVGVHGKSEDRDVLFLVRFDGDRPEHPEVDSKIKPMWYYRLVERWVE